MELILDKQCRQLSFDGTVAELLRELKVMREEVVVKVNGKLTPETATLKASDRVEVVKVVFGG